MMNIVCTYLLCIILVIHTIVHARLNEGEHDFSTQGLSYNADTFQENVPIKPHFVMFYAPWCGHCKRLSPIWGELGARYNLDSGSEITIAKVDCTQHTPLCASQEVTGYPTLKFFGKGIESGFKYRGGRELRALVKYLSEQLGTKVEDEMESPEIGGGLVEFTDETFKEAMKSGQYFVKFYAPWCGHCQRLAPVWDSLAKSLEYEKGITIAKLDCTKYGEFCTEYEVKGYPTLLWIEDGKRLEKYVGDRSHEDLKSFVATQIKKVTSEGIRAAGQEGTAQQSPVVVLTSENFKNAIETGLTFIKFFAPWCGHCKRMAPTYEELSRKFVGQPYVKIADVDCTNQLNRDLCSQQKVNGFPTLFLYRDGEKVEEYSGDRSLDDMVSFITVRLPHIEL